jgi:host factor-I protein
VDLSGSGEIREHPLGQGTVDLSNLLGSPIGQTDIMLIRLSDVEQYPSWGCLQKEQDIGRTGHPNASGNVPEAFARQQIGGHHLSGEWNTTSGPDQIIFLANGIRLQGRIRLFDNFTVQLVRGIGTQLVYKHAISAIHPVEPIELMDPASTE